ncbi:pilus assembly protein PilM [Roseimaritima ulvae]|uniref:Competence protein A n=1 Tax=Roseimaritima ulvae TaxID=980254 RepID=A0A5B9QLI7_9BACT|nr:pilus assembly protein PilM [Roseimaritima ulvae]QEG38460.1 Competence protein A [Roseimaritima ulvae]
MSTEIATSACAKCSHHNESQAKFCGGCGQPLWEPCGKCETTVRIGTKFCGGCGEDLQQRFQQRLQQAEDTLQQARKLAEGFEYDDALTVAKRHRKPADYRFQAVADQCVQLAQQIERARDAWQAKAAKVLEAARRAAAAENHAKTAALVTKIPEPLRCEELKNLLTKSRSADSQYSQLLDMLRDALQQKQYVTAANAVEGLLQIKPNEAKFAQAAKKIGDALQASAIRRFDRGDYHGTLQRLEALPQLVRNPQTAAMLRRAGNVAWLFDQFERQPWTTENLLQFSQRLTQTVPQDPRGKQLLEQVQASLKQPLGDPRSLYRVWSGKAKSWMGGPVRLLAFPQSLELPQQTLFKKHPGEFCIAIGLALQGLGKGTFTEALYRAETKGLKKLFRRKGPQECVGVDAGSSAIRAVRMRLSEDGAIELLDVWRRQFAQPLCRSGLEMQQTVLQEDDLLALKEWLGEGEAEIWINQPSRDVLGKFVEMPPVGDKQLQPLIEKEIQQRFPLAADELNLAVWCEAEREDQSRQVVLVAAKKTLVTQRIAKFQEFGIQPTAVQCEQAALVNFAVLEFADQLQTEGDDPADDAPPAVALVDAGASGTTLLIITANAFLFRSVDGGGEALTGQLARNAKLTAEQAEKWKHHPATATDPASCFPALTERMQGSVQRLRRAFDEAQQQLGVGAVSSVWCVGGGSRMHGWPVPWLDRSDAANEETMVDRDDDFEIG